MGEPMRKDEAHELVDKMPENATWDDLIDEIYVRQVIERGLADSWAGRTTDVEEVRRKYGLEVAAGQGVWVVGCGEVGLPM